MKSIKNIFVDFIPDTGFQIYSFEKWYNIAISEYCEI